MTWIATLFLIWRMIPSLRRIIQLFNFVFLIFCFNTPRMAAFYSTNPSFFVLMSCLTYTFFFINAHLFCRTQLGRKTRAGSSVSDWYLVGCYSVLVSGWMTTSRWSICLHLQSRCRSGWFVTPRSPNRIPRTDIMWRFYWLMSSHSVRNSRNLHSVSLHEWQMALIVEKKKMF